MNCNLTCERKLLHKRGNNLPYKEKTCRRRHVASANSRGKTALRTCEGLRMVVRKGALEWPGLERKCCLQWRRAGMAGPAAADTALIALCVGRIGRKRGF
eukprot:351361-Chlamydomonas_euryale.AAC.2